MQAFCRLSKDGGLCDNITQIEDESCGKFRSIRAFYNSLNKKRLENTINVEDFLTREMANLEWVQKRRLSDEERESLEVEVTLEELTKSLD
jgi:hypothetical protein